jgi:uncharacterized protein (DUF433 family)
MAWWSNRMIQKAEIINRGRGPEIAGTRITVYNVLDFRKIGWHRDRIAGHFLLSSDQIQAAFDYIDAHRDEVEAEYNKMLEWVKNYKYPPDVQAKIDAIRARADKRLEEIRARRRANGDHAGDTL